MDLLTTLGSVMSLLGIPSVSALILFLHHKHVTVLKEQISLLELEKERLQEDTSERLLKRLETRKQGYELLLKESEELLEEQKREYEDSIHTLTDEIKQLRRDKEIDALIEAHRSGEDYRFELLMERLHKAQ